MALAMALKSRTITGVRLPNPNKRRAVLHQRAVEAQPAKQIAGGIHERGMLMALTVGKWGISRDERGQADEVAVKNGADAALLTVRKKLVHKEVVAELTTLEGELRQTHNLLTSPWDDSGYRILSIAGYFTYTNKMNELIDKYNAAADKLVDQYDSIRYDAMKAQVKLFKESQWPSRDALRKKYRAKIHPRPIPLGEDFRVQMNDVEVNALRKQLAAEYEENTKGAQRSVWERLRKALEHAVEHLKAYTLNAEGKVENGFRDSLITNVQELLDIIPALNVMNDPAMVEFAARIRDEITSYPGGLLRAHDETRKQVISAADDMLAKMKEFMA